MKRCPDCGRLLDVDNAQRIVRGGKLVLACRDDRTCYKPAPKPVIVSRHTKLARRLAARYVI